MSCLETRRGIEVADIGRFFEVQEAIEYTKAAEGALGNHGAQEQADEWGASERVQNKFSKEVLIPEVTLTDVESELLPATGAEEANGGKRGRWCWWSRGFLTRPGLV